MLTMTVRAKDLAGLHELHRAASGHGMYYTKPYLTDHQIIGADGTLFTVSENSLVACTMAAWNRMIIHARILCANVDNNNGDLYAIETPKDFDSILRRFGDQHLALRFDDSRLEIVLPSPGNARKIIWLPLKRVTGRMLSVNFGEAATTFRLNIDPLIAALCRVPLGERWHLLAIQPTKAGFNFQYPVIAGVASERVPATILNDCGTISRFVCSTRSITKLAHVLKSLRKQSPTIQVQISSSTLTAWNDSVTLQFFADRKPNTWKCPSMPDTDMNIPEIQLLMDLHKTDLPKQSGKWLRRLVRSAKANRQQMETTWILSHDRVVVEIEGGIQTALEILCTCDRWSLAENEVSLVVDPLATAAILEICQKGTDDCRLIYQDSLLTIQSSSPSHEMIAHAILKKINESVSPRRTDAHTTRTTT